MSLSEEGVGNEYSFPPKPLARDPSTSKQATAVSSPSHVFSLGSRASSFRSEPSTRNHHHPHVATSREVSHAGNVPDGGRRASYDGGSDDVNPPASRRSCRRKSLCALSHLLEEDDRHRKIRRVHPKIRHSLDDVRSSAVLPGAAAEPRAPPWSPGFATRAAAARAAAAGRGKKRTGTRGVRVPNNAQHMRLLRRRRRNSIANPSSDGCQAAAAYLGTRTSVVGNKKLLSVPVGRSSLEELCQIGSPAAMRRLDSCGSQDWNKMMSWRSASSASSPACSSGDDDDSLFVEPDQLHVALRKEEELSVEMNFPKSCCGLYYQDRQLETEFASQLYGKYFVINSIVFGVFLVINCITIGSGLMGSDRVGAYLHAGVVAAVSALVILAWIPFLLSSRCCRCAEATRHVIGEFLTVGLWAAELSSHVGLYVYIMANTKKRVGPYLSGLVGVATAIFVFQLRTIPAIIGGVVSLLSLLVGHVAVLVITSEIRHEEIMLDLVSNVLLSLFPSLIAILPMLSLSVNTRAIFETRVRMTQVARLLSLRRQKAKTTLQHLIPKRYLHHVRACETVVDRKKGVSAIHIDLCGFTSWVGKSSAKIVVGFLNQFFTELDRLARTYHAMKLFQAGDGWAAVSLPHLGVFGRKALLQIAGCSFAVLDRVNKRCKTRRTMRIGIGFSNEEGLVVVWGSVTKSLDFVGEAIEQAIRMEHGGREGYVCVLPSLFELMVQDGLLHAAAPVMRTATGMCIRPQDCLPLPTERSTFSLSDGDVLSPPDSHYRESQRSSAIGSIGNRLRACPRVTCASLNTLCTSSEWFNSWTTSLRSALLRLAASCLLLCLQTHDMLSVGTPVYAFASKRTFATILVAGIAVCFTACFVVMRCAWVRRTTKVLNMTSVVILLLRVIVIVLCCIVYDEPTSVVKRAIFCGQVGFMLHPHLNVVIPLLAFIVQCVAVIVSFQIRHPGQISLMWLLVKYLAMPAFSTFVILLVILLRSAEFNSLRSIRQQLAEKRTELERKQRLVSNLMSSFLPVHCRDSLLAGRRLAHQNVCGGAILFGRVMLPPSLSMDESIQLLNSIFCALDRELLGHPLVYKVKSIRNMYLCAAPSSNLRDLLLVSQRFRSVEDGRYFRMGLQFGDFVAGVIGLDRFCWDCLGPTVNEASRLVEIASESCPLVTTERVLGDFLDHGSSFLKGEDLGEEELLWTVRKKGFVVLKGVGKVKVCGLGMRERKEGTSPSEMSVEIVG